MLVGPTIHNIQFGFDALPFDIESMVLKLYNYFSIYTVRTEQLKSFCEFVDVDYRQLLKHSRTRWLSLHPCIHRILQMFEPLQPNFASIEDPPKLLAQMFDNEVTDAYFWFAHSLTHCFHERIKKIERAESSVFEIIEVLDELNTILQNRISERLFSFNCQLALKKCEESVVVATKAILIDIYERSQKYLLKWRKQFERFNLILWMSLKTVPSWDDVEQSLSFFSEKSLTLDENNLFDQFCNLKSFLSVEVQSNDFLKLPSYKKWIKYFGDRQVEEYSQLMKMCQFVFSIPGHNASVERIFSLINSQWSDDRNKLLLKNVKGIVQVQFNFKNMGCGEFYDYLSEQKRINHKNFKK